MTHKLLLADDSVTIQRVVELTFSGEDVQVVTVGDGEQAIARIPIELPDIVLADIGMPKRSGYDVAAFVKGRADLSHIPVLLLAGAFEPVDENRAQQVQQRRRPGEAVRTTAGHLAGKRSDRELTKCLGRPRPAAAFADLHANGRDVGGPRSVADDAVSPSRTADVLESRDRSAETKLDDYFDRLDAAFAELGSELDRDKRSRQ